MPSPGFAFYQLMCQSNNNFLYTTNKLKLYNNIIIDNNNDRDNLYNRVPSFSHVCLVSAVVVETGRQPVPDPGNGKYHTSHSNTPIPLQVLTRAMKANVAVCNG